MCRESLIARLLQEQLELTLQHKLFAQEHYEGSGHIPCSVDPRSATTKARFLEQQTHESTLLDMHQRQTGQAS